MATQARETGWKEFKNSEGIHLHSLREAYESEGHTQFRGQLYCPLSTRSIVANLRDKNVGTLSSPAKKKNGCHAHILWATPTPPPSAIPFIINNSFDKRVQSTTANVAKIMSPGSFVVGK